MSPLAKKVVINSIKMLRFFSWPIRIHLVMLASLLALPSVGLIFYSGIAERDAAIQDAERECLKIANVIANEQDNLAAGIQQLATALGLLPEMQSRNTAAVNALLSALVKQNPQYANIAVTDKSGIVWASAMPIEGKVSFADRKYFKDAVRTGRFSAGEYAIGRVVNRPVITFGYPIRNIRGDRFGVITISVDVVHLKQVFKHINRSSELSFKLLDHRGTIIYGEPQDAVSERLEGKRDIGEEHFARMRDGSDEGTFEASLSSGDSRLFAYKKITLPQESMPYLYVRSSVSKDFVVSQANEAMIRHLVVLMPLFLIGLFLTWYFGKRVILKPVTILKQASQQLAKGVGFMNVSAAVRGRELGDLAHAFDNMAAALVQREEDKNRAESSLRESQARLDMALKSANMGVWQLNIFDNTRYFNDQACRLLGIDPETFTGTEEEFYAAVHPEDRQKVRETMSRTLELDVLYEPEYRVLWEDGSVHHITSRARMFRDGSGRPVRINGISWDITERKRSETETAVIAEIGRVISSSLEIDEVYERFAAEAKKLIAFDSLIVNCTNLLEDKVEIAYLSGLDIPERKVGDTIALKGLVSETAVRLRKGLIVQSTHADELVSLFPSLIVSVKAGIFSMMCVPLISRGEAIGTLTVRSKKPNNYTERDLRLAERIGEQIAGAIANARLFKDLNEAEKSMRVSEGRLKEAQGVAHLGNWTWNLKKNNLEWSEEMNRILGLDTGCFTGDLSRLIAKAVHPEDRPLIEEAKLSVTGEGKPFQVEFRVLWRDRSIHHVWAKSGEPILDDHGKPEVLTGIALDITERKRMEEERAQLETRLQRAEKMEALGTLAGGVAHDLNNVLGIVVGYSEMLLDELDETSPLRRDLMKIMEGGTRSAAIVQDLLTLARRGVQTRKVFNLNTAILNCRKTPEFEKFFSPRANILMKTDLEADLLHVMGSPIHLEKTIMNLISNAVEAMPNGGELAVTTSNRYLDRPIQGYDDVREGDYVVLAISDSGEGISVDDIKRIFEPFYTKKVMGRSGTGLGLAVVWGTVKDHGGYIDVQSEVGKGSTFTIYLPVTRENLATEQPSPSLSEYLGRGEAILVVDDVKGQRELAARMLVKLNYNVAAVSGGAEAVAYMEAGKADLVVLDMIMDPGIDGFETYQRILERNPTQRAIIVSGFSETERVKMAQELGAGAYVRKPYVLERLGLAVRKELDRKAGIPPQP